MSLIRASRRMNELEKGAAVLLKGFKVATEEADESELAYIRSELAKNPTLTHRLHSLVQNDGLVGALEGRAEVAVKQPAGRRKTGATLKARMTRFKHLTQMPTVISSILRALEESVHDDLLASGEDVQVQLNVLCLALKVSQGSLLPKQYLQGMGCVDAFTSACVVRYAVFSKPLHDKRLQDILNGHWAESGQKISSIYDERDEKAVVDLSFADDVQIQDPFDLDTVAIVTQGAAKFKVEDLKQTLSEAGVEFPDVMEKWTVKGAEPIFTVPADAAPNGGGRVSVRADMPRPASVMEKEVRAW